MQTWIEIAPPLLDPSLLVVAGLFAFIARPTTARRVAGGNGLSSPSEIILCTVTNAFVERREKFEPLRVVDR
jgi:hypothetical protein